MTVIITSYHYGHLCHTMSSMMFVPLLNLLRAATYSGNIAACWGNSRAPMSFFGLEGQSVLEVSAVTQLWARTAWSCTAARMTYLCQRRGLITTLGFSKVPPAYETHRKVRGLGNVTEPNQWLECIDVIPCWYDINIFITDITDITVLACDFGLYPYLALSVLFCLPIHP